MAELATRYPCPVCLGVTMDTVRIGEGGTALEIDHCGRCGGVWFDAGEVERLRRFPSAALWARIGENAVKVVTPCHRCHAPLDRDAEKCPSCGWKNQLDCPVCARLMKRRELGIVTVDFCGGCKGVWFDHDELRSVWETATNAIASRGPGSTPPRPRSRFDHNLDTLYYTSEIVDGVMVTAHLASHLPNAMAALPDAADVAVGAVHVVSVAGEAAGGIFEAIAAILEALFGLLDW